MRAIAPVILSLVALSSPSPQTIEDKTLALSYNDDRTRVIATFPSDPPIAISMTPTVVEQVIQNLATLRAEPAPFRDVDELRWAGPAPAFEAIAERLDRPNLVDRAQAIAKRSMTD